MKNFNNFKFKKSFGQNFLSDANLLSAICKDANVTKEDEILEIGPGAGALTKFLAIYAKKVIAVEIDKQLTETLTSSLENDNVKFIFADIMKLSKAEIESNFTKKFKIVANLPYYITTPILFKFLEGGFNISSITIMVQKEMGERLVAKSGTKDYGVITAKIDAIGDAKITRIVNRDMFVPIPNVDSCVVNIDIKDKNLNIISMPTFNKVVDAAFRMRRKTLVNNLMQSFEMSRDEAEDVLKEIGVDTKIRGEMLNTKQFAMLSNLIYNKKSD